MQTDLFSLFANGLIVLPLVGLLLAADTARSQDLRPTAAGDRDTAQAVEIDKGEPVEIYQRMRGETGTGPVYCRAYHADTAQLVNNWTYPRFLSAED